MEAIKPYGDRYPYEIASMLCCIEAREVLLRGLFWSLSNQKDRKGKQAYLSNRNIGKIIMGRALKMNDIIAFLGHRADDGRVQPLIEHLRGVSELAGHFADAFGEGRMGKLVGLYHDIGKYSKDFQDYIRAGGGQKVDHSSAGMRELMTAKRKELIAAAICVAGHHGGLPDGGTKVDAPDSGTLMGRCKKKLCDYSAYLEEWRAPTFESSSLQKAVQASKFAFMFYARMLFSCLVDADFLDTETFMRGEMERGAFASLETLKERLDAHVEQNFMHPTTEINKRRTRILQECIAAGDERDEPLQSLTVPTGGGKTIASLAFALHHAVKKGKRRIIYVIPYTSIIEQTAAIFRDILGDENVVEHHMQAEYDDNGETMSRQRLATENWDAPLIVTTNVQFFESLFANRTSRCRKLHNIVNSVVIFDEAQMIPVEFLRPCMEAVKELTEHYHCTALLCTATQPSLDKFFSQNIREICSDVAGNYDFFRRTTISRAASPLSLESLAARLMRERQVLCIVNTKREARELFEKLSGEGNWHLSTNLYPEHRKRQLDAIRKALKSGEPCRVVATSLIEAGVDVDFPCVYRQLAGLDSIVQAAGRCNREGKRAREESMVFVFRLEQEKKNPSIALNRNVAEAVCNNQEYAGDLGAPEAIRYYFDLLHRIESSGEKDGLDAHAILRNIENRHFPFAQTAKDFVLISESTEPVFIPFGREAEAIAESLRRGDYSRSLLRRAGKYIVSVRENFVQRLEEAGRIVAADDEKKLYILTDRDSYDDFVGLKDTAE